MTKDVVQRCIHDDLIAATKRCSTLSASLQYFLECNNTNKLEENFLLQLIDKIKFEID